MTSVRVTSLTDARIVVVLSSATWICMAGGIDACSERQQLQHVVHCLDDIRRGSLEDNDKNRRLAVERAAGMNVLDAVDHLRNVLNPHNAVCRGSRDLRSKLTLVVVAAGARICALDCALQRSRKPLDAAAELTGPRSVAMISGAYAAAPNNWSVVLIAPAPIHRPADIPSADSHSPCRSPRAAPPARARSCDSCVGFASIRTAGFALPPQNVCPTPSTCAIFCARMLSHASYICGT